MSFEVNLQYSEVGACPEMDLVPMLPFFVSLRDACSIVCREVYQVLGEIFQAPFRSHADIDLELNRCDRLKYSSNGPSTAAERVWRRISPGLMLCFGGPNSLHEYDKIREQRQKRALEAVIAERFRLSFEMFDGSGGSEEISATSSTPRECSNSRPGGWRAYRVCFQTSGTGSHSPIGSRISSSFIATVSVRNRIKVRYSGETVTSRSRRQA
jgi:hypothetical protein